MQTSSLHENPGQLTKFRIVLCAQGLKFCYENSMLVLSPLQLLIVATFGNFKGKNPGQISYYLSICLVRRLSKSTWSASCPGTIFWQILLHTVITMDLLNFDYAIILSSMEFALLPFKKKFHWNPNNILYFHWLKKFHLHKLLIHYLFFLDMFWPCMFFSFKKSPL